MAKAQLEECLICGEIPCACFAVKEKPKPRAKQPAAPPVKVEKADEPAAPKPSFKDAMKAAALMAPPPPVSRPLLKVAHVKREVNEADALFEAAIRDLRDLLHPDEMKKYAAILTSNPTAEERKVVWKARRREATNADMGTAP